MLPGYTGRPTGCAVRPDPSRVLGRARPIVALKMRPLAPIRRLGPKQARRVRSAPIMQLSITHNFKASVAGVLTFTALADTARFYTGNPVWR